MTLISTARLIVDQYTLCSTVEVIVLPGTNGPDERGKPDGTKKKRCRNQNQQNVQGIDSPLCRRCSRRAFKVTRSDEEDIATAATRGVTNPAIAKGTAQAL